MTDPKIKDDEFVAAASNLLRPHLDTDGFQISDLDDVVSRNEDAGNDGAFVKVWIWVDNTLAKVK